MSSWKKASKVNQKTHRERHQPESRSHLGILEKKKDYKKRADDFNQKKNIIRKLKNHALNRNPDEFYFHMINSKVVDGKHREKKKKVDEEDSEEQKKLMANRNINYVMMKRTMESKKIDRIQSQLHLIDIANSVPAKHIYYNDKGEAVEATPDTHPDLIYRRVNRPKADSLSNLPVPDVNPKKLSNLTKKRNKKYKALAKMIEREKQLGVIQRKMELSKYVNSSKEPPCKQIKQGSKTEPPVYEFKYQRKR